MEALVLSNMVNKKTPSLSDNFEKESTASNQPFLTEEEEQEIALFISNSHKYCEKAYGRIFEDEDEMERLRQEIAEGNKAVKRIRAEWGLT